jgi:hypothetical protein
MTNDSVKQKILFSSITREGPSDARETAKLTSNVSLNYFTIFYLFKFSSKALSSEFSLPISILRSQKQIV